MKLIKSKKPGLKVKRSANPSIDLLFGKEPIEVSDEVAAKLLENPNFVEVEKSKEKKKSKKEAV